MQSVSIMYELVDTWLTCDSSEKLLEANLYANRLCWGHNP
jgi:hypothetical protein